MNPELSFIDQLRSIATHPAARGLLDDAAVLDVGGTRLVLTLDTLVEGVHYLPDDPAETVAWKLVAANASDLAAKGVRLAGVEVVVAEGFERIHRSNLVGMGILPLVFTNGETRQSLGLKGDEIVDIDGVSSGLKPRKELDCTITKADGSVIKTKLLCRIDTPDELEYYRHGGILQYVMRQIMSGGSKQAA